MGDETKGDPIGWTILATGDDGSVLCQSPGGDVRRYWFEGVKEKQTQRTFTFYCTFGPGQPNFPGYFAVKVSAANKDAAILECRKRMYEATRGRWCAMYDSLDQMHPNDRVDRGKA